MHLLFSRTSLSFLAFIFFFTSAPAQEGMWLPQLVAQLKGEDMYEKGLRLSADDIYDLNEGSLKDAIVHFGGFCTSSVISPHGLLLTNHHCGYSAIQSHSTVENNLLKKGYWARSLEGELPNPGLSATFIRRISEVSDSMLRAVHDGMTESERQSKLDRNRNRILESLELEEYEQAEIKPFFHGNQYFLIVSVTYPDVRLVGTPPESIGKFGADTDNWEWPRHTGDFSLFRIYADTNNLPAPYAEENIPYKPDHYLPISLDGVSKGDFTMVFGFPGRTDEYLPAVAVEQLVEVRNPARIEIRETALDIMDEAMKSSEEIEIKYASKYASLSNYWKKWIGENQGIERTHALDSIRAAEDSFRKRLAEHGDWSRKYGHILPRYKQLYCEMEPLAVYRDYHGEITGRAVESLRYYNLLKRLVRVYEQNGKAAYEQYLPRFTGYFREQMDQYVPSLDQKVFTALIHKYVKDMEISSVLGGRSVEEWAEKIYTQGMVAHPDSFMAWFEKDPERAVQQIKGDPGYALTMALDDQYESNAAMELEEIQKELNRLDRQYMDALKAVYPERIYYPDANGTMRITYGQVKGYQPRDGVWYVPHTYLKGVIEKYIPGDYEFDLPPTLIELFRNKKYGKYADVHGMPVCFLGTNHTTGGNSGSPVIDGHGNLVGLNFDRVWEGTMSDYYYDKAVCRNIMVDARYILFIIDKFAEADHLLEEMRLVRPRMN